MFLFCQLPAFYFDVMMIYFVGDDAIEVVSWVTDAGRYDGWSRYYTASIIGTSLKVRPQYLIFT